MGKFSPVRHARALMLLDRVMRLSQYLPKDETIAFNFNSRTTGVDITHIVGNEVKVGLICWLDANDEYGSKLVELEAYIDAEEKRFMEAENNDKDTV